jgi:hypothetical protein
LLVPKDKTGFKPDIINAGTVIKPPPPAIVSMTPAKKAMQESITKICIERVSKIPSILN